MSKNFIFVKNSFVHLIFPAKLSSINIICFVFNAFIYADIDGDGIFSCTTLGKNGYELTITPDTVYRYVIDCNGERTEYYDDNGYLSKIVDRNGFVTLVNHTDTLTTITDCVTNKHIYIENGADGKVTRVYDDAQREVVFTYINDYLVNICDVNGNNLTY